MEKEMNQIIEMLKQMQDEQREFRKETQASFVEINTQLNRIEAKLDGAGR